MTEAKFPPRVWVGVKEGIYGDLVSHSLGLEPNYISLKEHGALLAAEKAKSEKLVEALWKASLRLEILTGRMRGCHEETGKHELLDEADMFCHEAKEALAEYRSQQ